MNKRQCELLELLNEPGATVIVPKKTVSMNDLLQLTNVTGDTFYMFTIGGRRLLIRGQGSNVNVSLELYAEITNGNYRFSRHTYPLGYLIESGPRDGPFLNDFGQMRSAI